ncbi:MAG: glutathione S-transferase N-terminal domain-containing protein [Pseudomonadota bacterium]
MIELFTAPTPNGHKVSVTLEELDLDYKVRAIDFSRKEQKEDWFLEISPNGRIPALIDNEPADGSSEPITVFESGAIMTYLADKTGALLPAEPRGRMEVMQWLMFQMGGIGPMMGQANVFLRYLDEKIPTAIERYQRECRRLFEVLDRRLGDSEWLAASFSIADIANWCWVRTYRWSDVSIDELPNLRRWLDAMKERPACRIGIQIPYKPENLLKDQEARDEFAARARRSLA